MNINPLFDRVVLKPERQPNTALSGLVLPEIAEDKSSIARVVAVSSGTNMDGQKISMQVKVGDKVLFSTIAGTPFCLDNNTYVLIRQMDIIAIIGEENE